TVTPSRHTKVQLQTLHDFPPHRTLCYPLGGGTVAMTGEMPLPTEVAKVLAAAPYFLAVGIDKPHKNWDFLMDRLADYWLATRNVPRLVVAGMPAESRGRVESLIARREIQGRVIFLPWLEDGQMINVYRQAR